MDATEPGINADFEENAPQQEFIMHEATARPGKEYLQESPELQTHINSKNSVQRY